jgi:hypothetical protein
MQRSLGLATALEAFLLLGDSPSIGQAHPQLTTVYENRMSAGSIKTASQRFFLFISVAQLRAMAPFDDRSVGIRCTRAE